MTTQLLASELANLIQESKRKNNDLRHAAEKSLEDLRSLGNVSEQAAPDQLAQKINFVNPFIIACGTKNAKFTAIAIVCLQRLIVSKGLPKSKLSQALEALMQASSAGLDVQLKILQALPSLLQNYSSELKGDLLVTALNICFTLQTSKNAIVNNTSAATLQQLIVTVFDKVASEDDHRTDPSTKAGEVATSDGNVDVGSAALDAYRIFNDLCLLTENRRPEFLRFSGLAQTFGLELIESVISNHASIFSTHPEQAHVLRVRLMPLIINSLKSQPTFAITIRLVRVLYTLLRRHIDTIPSECAEALDIMTQLLDQENPLWKRALCMEVFRGIFVDYSLVRRMYALYDANGGRKDIIKPLVAGLVRLSTEKPAVIGHGHQSTMPLFNASRDPGNSSDQAFLDTSSVTGIITTPSTIDSFNTGISTQWSTVRVPCIDQLDKTEPPAIPESYIYSLVLACISSLSDGLAKFILPLTVPGENRARRKTTRHEEGRESPGPSHVEGNSQLLRPRSDRSGSFKKNPVPVNPLLLEDHPLHSEVKICSAIVDECWPAVLATCSTFLYAALDSEYYHGLVRAFQRFAHVAGLLHLSTPRDAFLTTLGKAAVPPNVLAACLNSSQSRPSSSSANVETPGSLFENARGLLSPDAKAVGSSFTDKQRQASFEATMTTLNTRNLLCLRALLNLGIALGPTLGQAWKIVLESLQQADFVLYSTGKAPSRPSSLNRSQDQPGDSEAPSLVANFSQEVRSVETAASRLMESTVDFPSDAFLEVVKAICGLLLTQQSTQQCMETNDTTSALSPTTSHPPKTAAAQHRRVLSFSNQIASGSIQEDRFALTKIGEVATINIERLLVYPPNESGWDCIVEKLISTIDSTAMASTVRTTAAEILTKLMADAGSMAASVHGDSRGAIQLRILEAFRNALKFWSQQDRQVSVTVQSIDIDVHRIILDGLQSIIENCGESLVNGWETAFEIIGSIFVQTPSTCEDSRSPGGKSTFLKTRSPKLIRSSYGSLQLICSDFLASLPNSCLLILVDTLYKFCSQDDDLNIALTAVTFYWALSDFLSRKSESLKLTAEVMQDSEDELESMAADHERQGSDAALWMLLLLRLTAVASDDRVELRNSAIQTLVRIFDAYGDRLSPEAWFVCIKCVIFKLFISLEERLQASQDEDSDEMDGTEWTETAVVVLNGISGLFATYLEILIGHSSFNHLWRTLLDHLATLLDFKILNVSTAAFNALSRVLSQGDDDKRTIFNGTAIDLAWDLWSRGIPTSGKHQNADNQNCLISYVGALTEVYRLIEADLSEARVQRILELLHETVKEESTGVYAGDVENITRLQGKVLEAIVMMRTDVAGVPSAIIKQLSALISAAYDEGYAQRARTRRTFVAMSKANMRVLEGLVLKKASDRSIYESGALELALSALCQPIGLKYRFPIVTKSPQPWRLATSSGLTVLEATLPQISLLSLTPAAVQKIWVEIAAIADGILNAYCWEAPVGTDFADDEQFDLTSFGKLRALVIPSLGADVVTEKTRKSYVQSLFRASIIHDPASWDKSNIPGGHDGGIAAFYKPRPGRTVSVQPAIRSLMSYAAFNELFSLVSREEGCDLAPSADLPPSRSQGHESANSSSDSRLRTRIAATTASYLILRCALTLRGYVADQPLRGKMPQPLSQRKELIWMLRKLICLQSDQEAIPDLAGLESESRKHLLRLYPLFVQALSVGGDATVLELVRQALDVVGGELGL